MKQPKSFPQYKAGQRIQLVAMGTDPRPMLPGAQGTIDSVVDFGDGTAHLNMKWDKGTKGPLLNLCLPDDKIKIIG